MSSDLLFKPSSHWVDFLQRTGCVADDRAVFFRSTNELCNLTDGGGIAVIYNVDDREMSVTIPFSGLVVSGDPHRKHAIDFTGASPELHVAAHRGIYTVTIGKTFTFTNWENLVMRIGVKTT